MSTIERFENERANNYDNFVQQWIPNYDFVIGQLPWVLKAFLPKAAAEVLVAGCGTGSEILAFPSENRDWQVTGVDPSPDMIAQARKKLAGRKGVRLVEGLIGDLPSTPYFDAATLVLVLHFMPDDGTKAQLLQDIASRLKPGAPLVLVDIFGSPRQIKNNLRVLRSLLPQGLDEEHIEERLERIATKIHYIPEERLFELLSAVGFRAPTRFFQTAVYGAWVTTKQE